MQDAEVRREAIDHAYRSLGDDVYRVAFAILRDPEMAADATHETFTRAFERWEQYDSSRPLRSWLQGIAIHEALDRLQQSRVHRLATPAIARLALGRAEADDPELIATRRVFVAEAMDRLAPRDRVALVLRHAYGYSLAEIAELLDTSPGNVGSLLSRAHATLRTWIGAAERSQTHPTLVESSPLRRRRPR